MSLAHLHIHGLRNIQQAKLCLHPSINVFSGANGSGKTSLLEAFYLLSSGNSFKTRETLPLVHYGQPHLTVFGRNFDAETISLRKSIAGPTQVKLNNEPCYSSSILSRFLPCQLVYQDVFQIIDAGPAVRRSMLDWGVFHVKHEFHTIWKEYRHVLKQRNAVLRQRGQRKDIAPWDKLLVEHSHALDRLRQDYCQQWLSHFQSVLTQLTNLPCQIEYYRGWGRREQNIGLEQILHEQFNADCHRQYTYSGAHHADLIISSEHSSAKKSFSRGQQKIVSIALKLAQGKLTPKPCIYLFDDITAELDSQHINQLLTCIQQISGQKIITVLDHQAIDNLKEANYYYLNNGTIQPK